MERLMHAHSLAWKRKAEHALASALVMLLCAPTLFAAPAPTAQSTRTEAEVDKLIDEAGKTQPDWWDSTPLNIPSTLRLDWTTVKGWNNRVNLGAYFWDIIDPNPGKWKEGVKLAMHTYTLNKGNAVAQTKAVHTLSHIYGEMLQDYARAAFWAKKAGDQPILLADCYLRLGCKSAATEILRSLGADFTRNGQAIKLWADCGDLNTALAWAEKRAAAGDPVSAYLAAGDACRRAAQTAQAIQFYHKAITAKPGTNRDHNVNVKRATANLEAVKLFDALDLAKIPDGTYKASSIGYVGPVEMIVTVKDKKIESLKPGTHHEKQFYASFDDVPPRIITKQSVKGIDTTTGATVTSEAIINATAKALSAAQKP
jgi:uncharacterized protein with FMN-binding domain